LAERKVAANLVEGEVIRGIDGYEYVIVSRFADGSSTVKRVSYGALGSLKGTDTITLVSESPMREFLASVLWESNHGHVSWSNCIRANTNTTTIMIGEKVSDFIKEGK
jgi:hypothetical protein